MKKRKVIIVGGGAAGLLAAGSAAEAGAEVTILEKMYRPGRKLRITGKGRCNLTNDKPLADFISHFGSNGKFLRPAFSRFFTSDLKALLVQLGVPTVTERGGRVFPASDQAQDVVDALLRWIVRKGVIIKNKVEVKGFLIEKNRVIGVKASGEGSSKIHDFKADAVIITTGGASYPATGSTGDGYKLAEAIGHTVVPVRPALVPLETDGDIAPRLQGVSLRNVNARLIINGKKKAEEFGEMIFTHFGLSGPIILTMSKLAVDALELKRDVIISIDLKPALDEKKLDARLLRDIEEQGKKKYGSLIKGLLPQKMIPVCADMTNISLEKLCHQITTAERKRLKIWLKDFRFVVAGYRPFAEAIITAGGVSTREIDPRTMESKKVNDLYFAGEVLDIDADTGGYNLQAAFSTGWQAGQTAAE
ncbi:MAG: NAD(P)/FAD-dependent oxidoreductase [candidate division Zixibacteria bacterium]|nr:NAD(P)/FAD-dependent oxidoreductase [candidate division Zixibacteria bacterium]